MTDERQGVRVSGESFLENWLQFTAFHRARTAVAATNALCAEMDESIRASLFLDVVYQ